ncbi:odd-skipped family member drumstick isoform X1 [Anticarsia gemmatalis]|uniref:odd-skipped family member drumstick isoform X1 n=1 Tax=Anticarsia gemmatalis TaxID=129554 RepID=UPI003F767EC3
MWALPVLRTRGYLAAVEFHAHAASLGSLSPCDLYLVNLGSVVRCETSIRAPPSRATVILWTSSAAAPALERKRWLVVAGAVAKDANCAQNASSCASTANVDSRSLTT